MIANKAALLAVVAVLAEQALAFNSHRHLHNKLEKKAIKVEWHTEWETVYVTWGATNVKKPTGFVANMKPTEPTTTSVAPSTTPSLTTTTSTSTSTTTSTVVVPTTTTTVEIPPPAPTTTTTIQPEPTTEATTTSVAAADPAVNVLDVSVEAVVAPVPTTTAEPAPVPTTTTVAEVAPVVTTTTADTTTESSSSSSSSGSSSSVGFSSKRGMGYNDVNLANLFGAACHSCSWAWNWGSSTSGLSDGVAFVPMLWGPAPIHSDQWDSDAETALGNGAKAMMSFNECDNAGQCNLGPTQAAADHAKFMNKYSGKALIGAPSISNSGNPGEGIEWLTSFFEACDAQTDGCAVDFCPVHWYSQAEYSDTLFTHLEAAHTACGGKPIWLTEFAPIGGDDASTSSFLEEVLPKLEALDYLDAYSYFMVSVGSLMSSTSALGTYGQVYAS